MRLVLFTDYKMLVRIALILEMQKRGNEILIEANDNAETFFFAAQRLFLTFKQYFLLFP